MHTYTPCTVCGRTVIVDFLYPPGQRWHGFPDGTGHYFGFRPRSSEDERPGPNGDDAGSNPAVATKCE